MDYNYSPEYLEVLFHLMKKEKGYGIGIHNALGLKNVGFEMDLEEFYRLNRQNHERSLGNEVLETKVTTNIQEAIALLRLKTTLLRAHHLSCAADAGLGENTAICIHYRVKKSEKLFVLTLPGINYIRNPRDLASFESFLIPKR